MNPITSIDQLRRILTTERLALVYVSHPNCSVCHALKPQVSSLLESYADIRPYALDAHVVPEVASELSVFTVPVVLLFVDGKEVLRRARFVPLAELEYQLDRITAAL